MMKCRENMCIPMAEVCDQLVMALSIVNLEMMRECVLWIVRLVVNVTECHGLVNTEVLGLEI